LYFKSTENCVQPQQGTGSAQPRETQGGGRKEVEETEKDVGSVKKREKEETYMSKVPKNR
jgi:hypothetical protein